MPQGTGYLREFDAVNFANIPLRVMALVLCGAQSAVEIILMMNLYRWTLFVGPCLALVGNIQLQGAAVQPTQLQAVVDPAHTSQVEYQLVTPDGRTIPFTSMPAVVNGNVIIHMETIIHNVDNSIHARDISGTGIVLGQHSTTTVTQGGQPTA